MTIRLSLLLTLALSGLLAPVADAQTSSGNAAAASPYTQKRSQAYTSFDNPYAPGGIYDPYRSSKLLSSSQNGSLPSGTKTSKIQGLRSARMGAASGELAGGGSLGGGHGLGSGSTLGGSNSQCGGNRYGSSTGSGLAMNRPGISNAASHSSGMGSCTGSTGLGSGGLSHGSRSMGGSSMGKPQGMNGQGQAAGMQLQQLNRPQKLP